MAEIENFVRRKKSLSIFRQTRFYYLASKRRSAALCEINMKIRWITQKQANEFIVQHHRHHNAVVGSITQLGLFNENELVGVAILSRPVSRRIDFTKVVEVTRLCTDGTQNACSKLYSACARIAREMGFEKIQTYILASESGISLKASGWILEAENVGGKEWTNRIHYNLFGEEKRPTELKSLFSKTF